MGETCTTCSCYDSEKNQEVENGVSSNIIIDEQ